ncbi:MAG: DUF2834 domain-containing protein [Candidatus Heimdallarchaeota archaeon]|nr:MAG: DUF2834 domain-containing protein [Candidatus Heimdallarchaeota archaeon]
MENSETELQEQKQRNLLSSIKEFRVPWKEFLSPNLLFLLVWMSFLLYTFIWAPAAQPSDPGFGDFSIEYAKTNPVEWNLFMLVGVWALLYAVILLIENRERFIPAWPFVLASFAFGMYGLMPYFAIRGVKRKDPKTKKTWFTKIVDSRILGIILAALALALVLFGIIAASIGGGWSVYADSFLNVRFIQVMTIDFAFLTLFYPIVIWSDMKRRNWENIKLFSLFCVPLFGGLLYLVLRPRLPEK